jgi:hypothetical protein
MSNVPLLVRSLPILNVVPPWPPLASIRVVPRLLRALFSVIVLPDADVNQLAPLSIVTLPTVTAEVSVELPLVTVAS